MTSAKKETPIPMTTAGIDALKAELEELKARRPTLVQEVANARSQGDLSENFAYHDARQHLGMLDGRIQTIESSLRRVEAVSETGPQDVVRIGSEVVVRDEFGESSFQIVGPTEGNMARGLLSVASPLGRALVDRRSGETVSFATPGGQRQATIISIR